LLICDVSKVDAYRCVELGSETTYAESCAM